MLKALRQCKVKPQSNNHGLVVLQKRIWYTSNKWWLLEQLACSCCGAGDVIAFSYPCWQTINSQITSNWRHLPRYRCPHHITIWLCVLCNTNSRDKDFWKFWKMIRTFFVSGCIMWFWNLSGPSWRNMRWQGCKKDVHIQTHCKHQCCNINFMI